MVDVNPQESQFQNTSPIFSVVIPVFNRASSIEETLRSVSSQRFRDFECIVVDDGSTDDTCDRVRNFPWVKLLLQENSGPGTARNLGVSDARGQYIAFLDSDDLWFPWTLETYWRVICQTDRPAFVTGKEQCFSVSEQLNSVMPSIAEIEQFPDYFSSWDRWRWHGVSSFVVRRDIFLSVGGFAAGRINGEDAELTMRLGTAPGFVHVKNPRLFGYRVHPGNITHHAAKSLNGLHLLLQREAEGAFPGGKKRLRERNMLISRHVRPFAMTMAQQGEIAKAMSLYWQVLPELCRSGRVRFLAGLPLVAVAGFVRSLFAPNPAR